MNTIGYKVMAIYPTGSQADAEQKFHEVTQALLGKGCFVYILAENADGTESIVGTQTVFAPRPETRQEKLARLLRENKERREAEATRPPPKLSRKAKKRLKRKASA